MTRGRFLVLTLAFVVGVLVYFVWPVYGFYAHRGQLPLPPFGWASMPETEPPVSETYDGVSAQVARAATNAVSQHRERIAAPALTAAVGHGNKIVWAAAIGYADVDARRPATLTTAFRIGSTSKAVTATLFARLVDQGLVHPDQKIASIFAELPNSAWQSITLRDLAAHTSGLPHYKDNTDLIGLYATIALTTHFDSVKAALATFDGSALLYRPGEVFHYSTLGTVLLGAALAEAAGASYRDLILHEVSGPLRMASLRPAPRRGGPQNGVATSYFFANERMRPWRPVDLTHRLPGGGFAATSSDLVRLGLGWLNETYIDNATRERFWTPQKLNSGDINRQNYALGFRWSELTRANGDRIGFAHHGGVSRGAQSLLVIFPDVDLVIAVNSNRTTDEFRDFGSVFETLFEIFAAQD